VCILFMHPNLCKLATCYRHSNRIGIIALQRTEWSVDFGGTEPSVQREIEATHNINASVEARLSSTPQQDTLQSAAGRFTIGELGPHRMHFCAQTMRMFLRSILFGRGRDARKDNVPVCLRPSDAPAQMLAHNRKKSLPPLPPGARHQGDRVPSPEQSRSNVDRHGRQRTHAV
jgi:hypothetical protein